jgi:hypothetical protein
MQRSVLICSERHNASPFSWDHRILSITDELQVSRLLALAITALERGDPQVASGLTAMAVQFLDRAISVRQTGSVVQQQQQIQPKKEDA